jgi:hypothetical protein
MLNQSSRTAESIAHIRALDSARLETGSRVFFDSHMFPRGWKRWVAVAAMLMTAGRSAHAVELKVSAEALERTLIKQLFTAEGGRYYIRGKADSPCFVYAEDPKVSFEADRIVIHVKTHARLGTTIHGACFGVSLNTEADVSVMPEAEGESIGFRDARVDHLSESKELNYLLVPFLSKKLPQEMKINAAEQLRTVVSTSKQSIGYELTLDDMKIHSMTVANDVLVVDFDGTVSVH